MSEPKVRWGRVAGHRVQHAWKSSPVYAGVVPLCWGVVARWPRDIDFSSDAARCERCAARAARGAA